MIASGHRVVRGQILGTIPAAAAGPAADDEGGGRHPQHVAATSVSASTAGPSARPNADS
jgi:hypothetical protein